MKALLSLSLALAVLIKLSIGAPLDEFVRHYEPVNIVPKTTLTDDALIAQLDFKAFGREFNIHLETHHGLFEPDFYVETVGMDGQTTKKTVDTKGYVTGYVLGEFNSTVHGTLTKSTVDIVINSLGDSYHIEPMSKYSSVEGSYTNVIYKASDVVYNLKHTHCSSADLPRLRFAQETSEPLDNTLPNLYQLRRKRAVANERDTCSMKIVADYEFFREVGSSQESTTTQIMIEHIMNADIIFRRTTFDGELTGFGLSIDSVTIYMDDDPTTNPLVGQFSTEELLEAFAETNFDSVCLGHLFTYRDFSGVVGLAYLADPSGQLAGGICQKRTRTAMGELNLNTGFTSLLNVGRTVPRAVSYITTAHELGHNHGSPHDPPGLPCTPGGAEPKYIMFPSATVGGLKEFSECSRESIGTTLEARSNLCFIPSPTGGECGDGILQPGESCDCGSSNQTECTMRDPCCTVNCTLAVHANCSAQASSCCNGSSCLPLQADIICLTGDTAQGGCQEDSRCDGISPNCPSSTPSPDGSECNERQNVCEDGSCTGSPCSLFNDSKPCFCMNENEFCDVCCLFDGEDGACTSTLNREGVPDINVQAGYPCANFSGYCTAQQLCILVNNDDPLNKLRDILLDFTSIAQWLESNWYWILVGFACLIILIVLIQVTYRRKKIKTDTESTDGNNNNPRQRRRFGRQRRRNQQGETETYGYFQTHPLEEEAETSILLGQNRVTRPT